MICNNAIIPRLAPRPVPTSVPFTYRDGITTLELIECVKRNLNLLQSEFNGVVDEVNKTLSGVDDSLNNALDTMSAELESLRVELIRLINEAQGSGVYSNVVYGNDTSALQIMGDVYDNTRYYGLFARDYDSMEISALDYDTLETPARRYDLQGSRKPNTVLGDFTGREDFWAMLPAQPGIPQYEPFATKKYVDDNFMTVNPTVDQFDPRKEQHNDQHQ